MPFLLRRGSSRSEPNIDAALPADEVFLNLVGLFADFKRELMIERRKEGMPSPRVKASTGALRLAARASEVRRLKAEMHAAGHPGHHIISFTGKSRGCLLTAFAPHSHERATTLSLATGRINFQTVNKVLIRAASGFTDLFQGIRR